LTYEPSGRRRSFAVRTTTALTTSPFFTAPPGSASFTEPTITSPRLAYRLPDPPSTRMHRTSLAPVLSATLQRVSCWIIALPRLSAPCGALARRPRRRREPSRRRSPFILLAARRVLRPGGRFLLDDVFLHHVGQRTAFELARRDGLAALLQRLPVGASHGLRQ